MGIIIGSLPLDVKGLLLRGEYEFLPFHPADVLVVVVLFEEEGIVATGDGYHFPFAPEVENVNA